MTPLAIVAIVAVLGYYYYTLVAVTRFSGRRLWLLPLITAVFAAQNVPASLLTDGRELVAAALSVGVGVATGAFQGATITVERDTRGQVWQRGSWLAAVVLLLSLPLRLGLRVALFGTTALGVGALAAGSDVTFSLLAMLVAVLAARALTLLARYPWLLDEVLAQPSARRRVTPSRF
jgi:hypothetical protein